jgi:hypothetical protein
VRFFDINTVFQNVVISCKYLFSLTVRYDNDISEIIPPLIPDMPVSIPLTTTIDIQISYYFRVLLFASNSPFREGSGENSL